MIYRRKTVLVGQEINNFSVISINQTHVTFQCNECGDAIKRKHKDNPTFKCRMCRTNPFSTDYGSSFIANNTNQRELKDNEKEMIAKFLKKKPIKLCEDRE